MSQTPTERLKEYLGQLPPKAQALLMREFERSIERGENVQTANFILEQLRKVIRSSDEDAPPRSGDAARLVFRPLEPFLVDGNAPTRPGQVRRASLPPIWQWLARDGARQTVLDFEKALDEVSDDTSTPQLQIPLRALQDAAAEAISAITSPSQGGDHHRALARVGPPSVTDDLSSIGAVMAAREPLDTLSARLPSFLRVLGDSQIASVSAALDVPSLQRPQVLPFALSLVMQRLASSWQIIRLAIKNAASDDEVRVGATVSGVAVTMTLHDLAQVSGDLRGCIKRGHFDNVSEYLKTVHDGVRGLRTELDLRNDSTWGRQLAAIRADISNVLQSEIDSVPGRVRRLLRQRTDKDISANSRIDPVDVDETAELIDFVAACRTYAGELAINEVTLRTYSDLQQYLERSTEALVESLRSSDPRTRGFRQLQVKAAIRFCDVLFGSDYASLMRRAAENALAGERKSASTA